MFRDKVKQVKLFKIDVQRQGEASQTVKMFRDKTRLRFIVSRRTQILKVIKISIGLGLINSRSLEEILLFWNILSQPN